MPVKAKNIKDLPLKRELDGSESLLVQDSYGTKQAPLGTIVDEIKQNSQEKIREIESELNQTNAQLSQKANESDLITERKRIDNLTKLNDGSTTGDAELIDGRIGCDGITYSNIGSAIRTQIDKLKDSLLMESITFDLDGYINYLGEDEPLSGWKKTNYIKVNKGDVAQVNAQGYKTNVSVIHFYNLNKKAIQSLQIGNDKEQTFTQVIPEDGYVRFSGMQSERLHANIYRNNPATVDIALRFNSEFNLGIDFNWTDGGYVRFDSGEIVSFDGYSYSDFIDISDITGIFMNVTEYYDYVTGIAFYDENEIYISGIGIETNTPNPNLGQLIEIQLKGHYMRLTCKTAFINKFKMYTSIKQIIKSTNRNEEELINPCFYKENPNLIKMFNRIICIGDSYTEGSIEYKNESGTALQSVASKYSYPTILSKISGVETVNHGRSGYTSSRWFDEYKNTDLSGFDCAIIFLGINDWYNNGKTLNTEAYSGIINKLRNENKGIPIFCVTITQNYNWGPCNVNEQIRQVATENSCYIIDLEKYSDWTPNSSWLNGGHPNSYGYYHNAEMINCYINFIIANNLSEFYNISFVGTTKIPV